MLKMGLDKWEFCCFSNNLMTPLHLAIERKHTGIAEYLAENGSDVNAEDDI